MSAGIASPCVGVCQLQPGAEICEGCLRTLDEISEWARASDARRESILREIAERRRRANAAAGAPPVQDRS